MNELAALPAVRRASALLAWECLANYADETGLLDEVDQISEFLPTSIMAAPQVAVEDLIMVGILVKIDASTYRVVPVPSR